MHFKGYPRAAASPASQLGFQSIAHAVSWLVEPRCLGALSLKTAARDPVSRALGVLALGHAFKGSPRATASPASQLVFR